MPGLDFKFSYWRMRKSVWKLTQVLRCLLDEEGIIYKVSQSVLAASVMLVPKKDSSLRVCGDYKSTVNQCANVDQYPLPSENVVCGIIWWSGVQKNLSITCLSAS